jgi:hypothetical protein
MTRRDLQKRVESLEQRQDREIREWLEHVMPTLSDEQLDRICRGGPGQLDFTKMTEDQLLQLEHGEALETAVPNWRELRNPGERGDAF